MHAANSRSVLGERNTLATMNSDIYGNHRDSGTSSPINPDATVDNTHQNRTNKILSRSANDSNTTPLMKALNNSQNITPNYEHQTCDETEEELSDSNDSVFSSGSSIDSILNYNSQEHLLNEETESLDLRDLYLGGSCVLRTRWRDEIIPMLNEQNITYRMPQLHESLAHRKPPNDECDDLPSHRTPESNSNSSKPLETCSSNDSGIGNGTSPQRNGTVTRRMFNSSLLESSRVLLFVISNETRSLAPMTLAAHCIGLGYNVVLCVQMLPERCIIGDDQVYFEFFFDTIQNLLMFLILFS